jgi:hypothetical protein
MPPLGKVMPQTLLTAAIMGTTVSASCPVAAADGDAVSLFRIVTTRDEVTVGLTNAELGGAGERPALEAVAERLARQGYLISWQYASGRGTDGSVRQMPVRRIAVHSGGVVRIEPFRTEQPIDLPKN